MAKFLIVPGHTHYGILATRDNPEVTSEIMEFEFVHDDSLDREGVWKLAEKMVGPLGWNVCAMRVVGGRERATAWYPQHLFVSGATTAPKN